MELVPPLACACPRSCRTRETRKGGPRFARSIALFLTMAALPLPAAAQKVRITNLSDVNFGLISNLQADTRQSQSICLYSQSSGGRYSITATGSGTGSSFLLSNGSSSLPYEIEWSDQSGQTTGTSLTPSVTATGRASAPSRACDTVRGVAHCRA